jgi:DivIVA domain-containing protein
VPLTPEGVRNAQFSTTRLRPGYDMADVDAFLDRLGRVLESLTADNIALRDMLDRVRLGALPPDDLPPPVRDLTPENVRRIVFKTTRLRPGYDEREVDAALDDAQVVIGVLIQENDELRARLSAA